MTKTIKVNLDRPVKYESLESALVEAAKDIGWGTDFEYRNIDKFNSDSIDGYYDSYYRIEDADIDEYDYLIITLKGIVLPAAKIYIFDEEEMKDSFDLHVGFGFGYASEKKIETYRNTVQEKLRNHKNNYQL
jgi:hypothetical protein